MLVRIIPKVGIDEIQMKHSYVTSWVVLRCEHSLVPVRYTFYHGATSLLNRDVHASRCLLPAVALATLESSCLLPWCVSILQIGEAGS